MATDPTQTWTLRTTGATGVLFACRYSSDFNKWIIVGKNGTILIAVPGV